MATVCAIIPTYNRAAMLRECIDSVLAQSRPPDSVIVVNDGSTDDTEATVKSYGSRVTLLTKSNGGKAAALNFALSRCTSDYIWICDDDDIADRDGLKHLVTALDENPDAGFAYGTFKIFRDDAAGRHFMPPTYWVREGEPNTHIQFMEEMFTFQYAMLVRRSLYQKAGNFREDLIRSQDHEMVIRLSRAAKCISVPDVVFYQRAHSGQRGAAATSFAAQSSAQKWLEYGQKIFGGIYKSYALEEFTPTFARGSDRPLAQRAALLQRALICAERGLWDLTIQDLKQANSLSPLHATQNELNLAGSLIRQLVAWKTLEDHPLWCGELHTLYQSNFYSSPVIFAMCRPLAWHIRGCFMRGEWQDGFMMLRVMNGVLGTFGTILKLFSQLSRRLKHGLSWRWERISYKVLTYINLLYQNLRWRFVAEGRPHNLPKPLIVSLTSYPARFHGLEQTLRALLRQTIKPDHVILWVAEKDFDQLPAGVLGLQSAGLKIRKTTDTRSYKKILPTLEAFPDSYIATADDDILYWPSWLEELVAGMSPDNKTVSCHRAHGIVGDDSGGYGPYDQWRLDVHERGSGRNFFPTGIGGILYPPGILLHSAEDRDTALELCPHGDDVWLYWIGRRNGAHYKTVGRHRKLVLRPATQHEALYYNNMSLSRNDVQIKKIAEKYGFPAIT